ncbi:MAG: glycosyltransferase family 9 protein [Verrucomicrobiales bacterium]|nr:glycosyltransferase family 9 protein [Verrucomicrobiales bacterium]
MSQRWLFLAARNFGDALISAGLVARVAASFPKDRIEVWTRPQFVDLFRETGGAAEFHVSQFPVGTRKNFGLVEAVRLVVTIGRLRRRRFDVVVNDVGDFRECALVRTLGARRQAAPIWPRRHPALKVFRRWGTHRLVNWPLEVPADVVNIYDVREFVARSLGCPEQTESRVPRRPKFGRVGLHPFATKDCRQWPWDSWRNLARQLASTGQTVVAFGSVQERAVLEREFDGEPVTISSGSLVEFLRALDGLDVLVALDSFGIHAASARRTPAVHINGASNHLLWRPPEVRGLVNGGQCPHHPCYCRPKCPAPGIERYACIHGISWQSVLAEVRSVLAAIPGVPGENSAGQDPSVLNVP